MRLPFLLCALVAVHTASAASSARSIRARCTRRNESNTPGDQQVEITMSLSPGDPRLLDRAIYEVSDPSSPRYGQHLAREEALDLAKPGESSVQAVLGWLTDAGVSEADVEHRVDWMRVSVPLAQAHRLLPNASLANHLQPRGRKARATLQLQSVPQSLRDHVATIHLMMNPLSRANTNSCPSSEQPILDQNSHSSRQNRRSPVIEEDLDPGEELMTLQRIKSLYKVANYTEKPAPGLSIGVVGFGQQQAQFAELDSFLAEYAPEARGRTFSADLVNGGKLEQGLVPSSEANMNVQLVVGLAHPVPVRFYSVGGSGEWVPDLDAPADQPNPVEPWLEFAQHLLELPDAELPRVLSISYGENEQLIPKAYAQKVCSMFGQLGTRGVSVLAASGNFGVGMSCQANDNKKTTKFLPEWLGTCPWVTAVGATSGSDPEEAVYMKYEDGSIFTSGGGFSDFFPRPKYQDQAVSGWLANNNGKWSEYFNEGGRAVPDVSAQGLNIPYWTHGSLRTDGAGTSAATPIFAAIVALLNNERMLAGKRPLGFLNPWLYAQGYKGLTDILKGRNHGCPGESFAGLPAPKIPDAGWEAVEAWDPVTGLGTPVFGEMRELMA